MVPVLRQPGRPIRMERVRLDPPRAGEVRVRMVASGVCHSCLHTADGSSPGRPMPIVLGDEGAGVIDAVGDGCAARRPGDHVVLSWAPSCRACRQCLRGRPARCTRKVPFGFADEHSTRFHEPSGAPIHHFGPSTYSPYVVVPEAAAIPIRPEVPLEVAALIGCSVMTGVGAVLTTSPVAAGQSVAVVGCGGVGLNVVQTARLAGAHPIVAVDVVPSKLDFARRLGATHVVDARSDDPATAVAGLTDHGVDHVFVATDARAAIEGAIAILAPGGACVLIGAPPRERQVTFDAVALRAIEGRILGCAYGSANPAVDFQRIADLYLAGRLRLDELITRRYRLPEAAAAFEHLAAGDDARGLIVF